VERRQDGFKAHVVIEPDTGLDHGRADQGRRPGQQRRHRRCRLVVADPTIDSPVEVLGDSAYATGDMLAVLEAKRWVPLVKPWPIRPAVEDGFTIDDFTHDPAAGTLTCPAGVTKTITKTRKAVFGHRLPGLPVQAAMHDRRERPHHPAPPPRPAATRSTANGPPTRASRPPTGSTGPWSNARSPG
jgi:hypothetical protein